MTHILMEQQRESRNRPTPIGQLIFGKWAKVIQWVKSTILNTIRYPLTKKQNEIKTYPNTLTLFQLNSNYISNLNKKYEL